MKHIPVTALVLGLMVATSDAGSKFNYPVVIGATSATGSMADARSSALATMNIGCHTRYGANTHVAACSAGDGQGLVASCFTTDPVLVDQARALGDDSRVTFWWDATGTCTQIQVLKFSSAAPKVP